MFNIIVFYLLFFISIPAYAAGIQPDNLGDIFICLIYFSPFLFGIGLLGKRTRFRFSVISFIIYGISLLLLSTTSAHHLTLLLYFFLPLVLILIAVLIRKPKRIRNAI